MRIRARENKNAHANEDSMGMKDVEMK